MQGVVTSYWGPDSEKYSSYQAHTGPVGQLAFTNSSVASVGHNTLQLRSRGGICHYEIRYKRNVQHLNHLLSLSKGATY